MVGDIPTDCQKSASTLPNLFLYVDLMRLAPSRTAKLIGNNFVTLNKLESKNTCPFLDYSTRNANRADVVIYEINRKCIHDSGLSGRIEKVRFISNGT